MRDPSVDGHGNFGSVDGDSRPAADRYTEIRLAKISHEIVADLDKDTVNFVANYDNTEKMPLVLPTRSNLLVNGSSGIAVGMATNIPPHNLGEVVDACLHLVDHPDASFSDLLSYIHGPDFPTAGIVNGRSGIVEAYKTGRKIYMRAKAEFEHQEKLNKSAIVITELPYAVNKAKLCEKIGQLVREKKLMASLLFVMSQAEKVCEWLLNVVVGRALI